MSKYATQGIIGVCGMVAIGAACFVSKSGEPLWAMILLAYVIGYIK